MKAKVYTYANNGNDIICKNMEITKCNENIYYSEMGDNSSVDYMLIIESAEDFFALHVTSLANIQKLTYDYFVNFMEQKANNGNCFNKLELMICERISSDLYLRAKQAHNTFLNKRKKEEDAEIEERNKKREKEEELERLEREKKRAEQVAEKTKRDKWFDENKDLLISNLTDFQKLTAYSELNKARMFSGQVKTYLNIIREGYSTKHCYLKEYSNNKVNLCYQKLTKPKRECCLMNGSIMYDIPAKLYDLLNLPE
jgi:hypothetical protein